VVVEGMIVPPVNHGLRIMSIGFFVEPDQAVVWRGPMLHKALEQFLTDVHWGELDYLVVDMPPGTGDVSISLGQLLPSPDVVIVTTPQAAAQQVAERSAEVAAKTGMHVAGVIENMSYLVCPCCGERSHVFGEGGGRALADRLGVPLLGEIPLDEPLRQAADAGRPLVLEDADAASARAVADIAAALPGVLRPRSGAERIDRRLSVR
jgi:ATP-binding protein involved in chromosome partitioning